MKINRQEDARERGDSLAVNTLAGKQVRAEIMVEVGRCSEATIRSLVRVLKSGASPPSWLESQLDALHLAVAGVRHCDQRAFLNHLVAGNTVVLVVDNNDRVVACQGRGLAGTSFTSSEAYGEDLGFVARHIGSLALCTVVALARSSNRDQHVHHGGWLFQAHPCEPTGLMVILSRSKGPTSASKL